MQDDLKSMAIWAGLGAALGLGVAMGLGFRALAAGALVGVGTGLALGVGETVVDHKRRHLRADAPPALH